MLTFGKRLVNEIKIVIEKQAKREKSSIFSV